MSKVAIVDDNNFDDVVLKNEGKVLVKFGAPWCAPCKTMTPILEQFAEDNSDILVADVDISNNNQLMEDYSISGVPHFMFFMNGELRTEFSGLTLAEDINSIIKEVLNDSGNQEDLL